MHRKWEKYPKQLFMADISSVEKAINAEKVGFPMLEQLL